jgi:hypothetical protein
VLEAVGFEAGLHHDDGAVDLRQPAFVHVGEQVRHALFCPRRSELAEAAP